MSESPSASGTSRPNAHPFVYSFAMAGVVLLISVIAMVVLLGPSASAYLTGYVVFPVGIGAIVAGFVARSSQRPWGWWHYVLLVVGVGLALSILPGRMAAGT